MVEFNTVYRESRRARKLVSKTAKTFSSVLFECPMDRNITLVSMHITSVHTGSVTLRLHHLTGGESEGISNALYYDLSISAKTTNIDDTIKYMTAGDRLTFSASGADHIVVTLYGYES
jgi:hypothetical protein